MYRTQPPSVQRGASGIEKPNAYSVFKPADVSSWMDGLQEKISRGLNPPESPGPSRSPSPIQVEQLELVQHVEILPEGLHIESMESVGILALEDEAGSESEAEDDDYEDDEAIGEDEAIDHAETQQSREQTAVIELSDDGDDDDEEEPADYEEEVQTDNEDDNEVEEGPSYQLFESKSQDDYDPAYGVAAEEDGAAYVGSDGDVYGDEDEDQVGFDEDSDENPEDAEDKQSEADDVIEYTGASGSTTFEHTNAHASTSMSPNTLYPTLPPPPPLFVEQNMMYNPEDQISNLPPFSDDAIDPNLLAEIVQQVHEAMPEDDMAPLVTTGSIPHQYDFEEQVQLGDQAYPAPFSTNDYHPAAEVEYAQPYSYRPEGSPLPAPPPLDMMQTQDILQAQTRFEHSYDEDGEVNGSEGREEDELEDDKDPKSYDELEVSELESRGSEQREEEVTTEEEAEDEQEEEDDEEEEAEEEEEEEEQYEYLGPGPTHRPFVPAARMMPSNEVIEIGSSSDEGDGDDDDENLGQSQTDAGGDKEGGQEEEDEDEEDEEEGEEEEEEGEEDEDEDEEEEEEEEEVEVVERGEEGSDDDGSAQAVLLVAENQLSQEQQEDPPEGEQQLAEFREPSPVQGDVFNIDHAPNPAEAGPAEEAIVYDGEIIEDHHALADVTDSATLSATAETSLVDELDEPMQVEEVEHIDVDQEEQSGQQVDNASQPGQPSPEIQERICVEVTQESRTVVTEPIDTMPQISVESGAISQTAMEPLTEPEVTDSFTMDVEEGPTEETHERSSLSEDPTPSPLLVPAIKAANEAFNGEDYIAFDSLDTSDSMAGASAAPSPIAMADPSEMASISASASVIQDDTRPPSEAVNILMGDSLEALPDPRLSPPDAETIMPVIPHIQRSRSKISPSLLVEPPADPIPAEFVSPDEASRPETPISFPDPTSLPPDSEMVMPLDPHTSVPMGSRSPSLAVEPPEADPIPQDIDSYSSTRASSPVLLPDPTVPPPNTSAVQQLDIHDIIPKENFTPSLIVEPPQDPSLDDLPSAAPSRAPTPPNLPDYRLSAPDTTTISPLDYRNIVPHPVTSPSLIVEPPGADPIPGDIFSVPASRAASPVSFPDPLQAPPDSYLEAPITPHDLSAPDRSRTPSLDVAPPTESPTASVSRVASGFGSVVESADFDMFADDDEDVRIDVQQISPQAPVENGGSPATAEHDRNQSIGEGPATADLTGSNDSVDEGDIQVEVHQVEPDSKVVADEQRETGVPSLSAHESSATEDDDTVDSSPENAVTEKQPSEVGEGSAVKSDDLDESAADQPSQLEEEEEVNVAESEDAQTVTGSPVKEHSREEPPPLPHMTASAILRLRHMHGTASDVAPPVEATHRRTRSRARTSNSPAPEPPVTRSHCYYEKLRVSDDEITAVLLVPHCTVSDAKQLEEETSEVEGTATDEEEIEARYRQMSQQSPILHPRLVTKLRRIVGDQLFDDGHCYLLYAHDSAKLPDPELLDTPKSTGSSRHRKIKSTSALLSSLSAADDEQVTATEFGTPEKKGTPLPGAVVTRSGRKRATASASVEPDHEVNVTPGRRSSLKPASARKGKARESSVISDTGSWQSTTGSPGPGLRRSARVSAARGQDIPEEPSSVPETVDEEAEVQVKSETASPVREMSQDIHTPSKIGTRRSNRLSLPPARYSPSVEPEPTFATKADSEVRSTNQTPSASPEKAAPSSATRLRARKSLTLASRIDEAPYRPDEEDEEEDDVSNGPPSAQSALSVEIPSRKRKSPASPAGPEEGSSSALTLTSVTKKRKADSDTESDASVKEDGDAENDQDHNLSGNDERKTKRRAVESRLVPGTPVPEPRPEGQGEEEGDEDIEVSMTIDKNGAPDSSAEQTEEQRSSRRSSRWGILGRFWGRR